MTELHVLCRSLEHVAAALECGVSSVVTDLRDLADCGAAVRMVRRRFGKILLATPRIHRPGENDVLQRLAGFGPDGLLVRNLAGLAFCRERGLPAVADFSLNAANELTVAWLHAQGARRITTSYDLDREQLLDLTAAVPPEWLEVVIHHHTPLFHSAHCIFCALLSSGRDRTDCGRPCQRHQVRLRDRLGVEHPLTADSQCRNTLFHAHARSLMESVPKLTARGIRHFRLELLGTEDSEEIHRLTKRVRGVLNEHPGSIGF